MNSIVTLDRATPCHEHEADPLLGELFLAGECVPAGLYRQIDSRREVCLETEDYLPASMDGRVACYERIAYSWKPQ